MKLDRDTAITDQPGWHSSHPPAGRCPLATSYEDIRSLTQRLCAPLAVEDYVVQSMPDCSPARWHLAHTSWFFETFVLALAFPGYRPFHPQYNYLFNSYYNGVGDRWTRARRGVLSRPTVEEIFRYRAHVDGHMRRLFQEGERAALPPLGPRIVLGLHHEQQHQELLLTDVKHAFGCNPLYPTYREQSPGSAHPAMPLRWADYPGGLRWIGHEGRDFAYDNETPRHRVFVSPFHLACRLVTSGEYRAFMEDGGYQRAEFWLADGWDARQKHGWEAPLYWERRDGAWWSLTLGGLHPVRDEDPLCHVSYYEADAYARWAGARLPTEAEWETAALDCPLTGNFLDSQRLHPVSLATPSDNELPAQMFGDVWEWTASPYTPYPGFQPLEGTLGEYNGKFMANQMVLRGGSCATPLSHLRRTYRNFFPPEARWQFTGIRLARNP